MFRSSNIKICIAALISAALLLTGCAGGNAPVQSAAPDLSPSVTPEVSYTPEPETTPVPTETVPEQSAFMEDGKYIVMRTDVNRHTVFDNYGKPVGMFRSRTYYDKYIYDKSDVLICSMDDGNGGNKLCLYSLAVMDYISETDGESSWYSVIGRTGEKYAGTDSSATAAAMMTDTGTGRIDFLAQDGAVLASYEPAPHEDAWFFDCILQPCEDGLLVYSIGYDYSDYSGREYHFAVKPMIVDIYGNKVQDFSSLVYDECYLWRPVVALGDYLMIAHQFDDSNIYDVVTRSGEVMLKNIVEIDNYGGGFSGFVMDPETRVVYNSALETVGTIEDPDTYPIGGGEYVDGIRYDFGGGRTINGICSDFVGSESRCILAEIDGDVFKTAINGEYREVKLKYDNMIISSMSDRYAFCVKWDTDREYGDFIDHSTGEHLLEDGNYISVQIYNDCIIALKDMDPDSYGDGVHEIYSPDMELLWTTSELNGLYYIGHGMISLTRGNMMGITDLEGNWLIKTTYLSPE